MIYTLKPPKNGYRYKVIAYKRVSRLERTTGSHTFETQERVIKEWLDRRLGENQYDYEELIDDGVSGGYGPKPTLSERRIRPNLNELDRRLRTGVYDGFIFYKWDRLFRTIRWSYQFLEDTLLPTVNFCISASENLDFTTQDGRRQLAWAAAQAEQERDNIKQRNQDGADSRREMGYYLGQVPYGWQWEPVGDIPPNGRRRIFPIPEKGKWVIQMKDWYLAGWNFIKIAGELNKLGVDSPSGKAKWLGEVVRHVMSSPLHAGMIDTPKGIKQGEHFDRRFYDPDVYDLLLDTRSRRKRWATNTVKTPVNLLAGAVFCGRCGKPLKVNNHGTPVSAYYCGNGVYQGQRTCPGVVIRVTWLEKIIIEEIEKLSCSPEMQDLLIEEATLATEKEDLLLQERSEQYQKAKISTEQRMKKWADLFTRDQIPEEQFVQMNRDMMHELGEIDEELAKIEDRLKKKSVREARIKQVKETILDFKAIWENLDLFQRREVLSLLIEYIIMDRHEKELRLKVKLLLLPEKEITTHYGAWIKRKERPEGVNRLTKRHLAYLYYCSKGLTQKEIADKMGVMITTMKAYSMRIRKILKVKDLSKAVEMAQGRLDDEAGRLPLGKTPWVKVKDKNANPLSPILMEVFPMFADGASSTEVAELTGIPRKTVVARRDRILQLFQVRTMFEAVQKAKKMGILKS